MRKGRKIALIILASVSASFLVAFTVLFFIFPLLFGLGGAFNFAAMFESLFALFAYPFSDAPSETLYLVLSIMDYVVSGIVLITLVLGIVYACIRKKFAYLAFIPVMFLAELAALALIAYGETFVGSFESGLVSYMVVCLILLILGILGFVLTYVTYILGMVFAKDHGYYEQRSIAPVAEQAADPEVVEEGQELEAFAVPAVEEPVVQSEPVEEPAPEPEPAPVEEEKKEEEPAPEKSEGNNVNVNVNNTAGPQGNGLDQNSLASLLREVVRDIVRDEIARNNANQPQKAEPAPAGNQTITGATFGGPLVVQYFNGGINGVTPAQPTPVIVEAPKPAVEEKKPEPVKEEPKPEPVVEPVKEEPKPEPVPEPVKEEPAPAPVVEVKPTPLFVKKEEPAGKPEAPKYERISFAERLLKSDKELHELYNELKNEILSYGVKSRISAVGDTFRLHKKMYVRITVAGKSLKLYFALDPKDYEGSTIPVQDASGKEMYAEIPLVFKVKSGLSVRRCKELIQAVMEKDNLEQGEVGKVNWIKELKAELAADKKKEKEA